MQIFRFIFTIFYCLFSLLLYSQDSGIKYEFGVSVHHSIFKKNSNSIATSKDKSTLIFSVNRKSNFKNGFSLITGVNYKNLNLQHSSNEAIILNMNDSFLESNGSIDFEILNLGENWIGDYQTKAKYRINYVGDESDYQNTELIEYLVLVNYTIHTLSIQLGVEKKMGKGKNKFKIEGALNPFFNFSPSWNTTKYRDLGISLIETKFGYFSDGQYIKRIEQIEEDFNLTRNNINTFGVDVSLAFGLVHKKKHQILVNVRRNLNSISSKEKIYIQSVGLEIRYQI